MPDEISPEEACMLADMVPTGFHGVELADIQLVIPFSHRHWSVGLMAVAGANLRGAARIIAVGSRLLQLKLLKDMVQLISCYKDGPIDEQVLDLTNGKGVDRIVIAGGDVSTFEPAIKALKPAGKIGNVNYLGGGVYIQIPRVNGCRYGTQQIVGGLMPGGRLRMEKLSQLVVNKWTSIP